MQFADHVSRLNGKPVVHPPVRPRCDMAIETEEGRFLQGNGGAFAFQPRQDDGTYGVLDARKMPKRFVRRRSAAKKEAA